MKIALSSIRFDGQTQMRAEINGDTVADYRDAMKSGAEFPPIKLFFDGCDYWIGDGYHRWHARGDAGFIDIEADVVQGSRRDAILWACSANCTNGLRRSNVDKRKAVETLLRDEEWMQWSDHVIADKCGVSQPFVGGIRKQLITVIGCDNGQSARKSADGKSRRPPQKKEPPAAPAKAGNPAPVKGESEPKKPLDTPPKGECIAGGRHEWDFDGDGAEYCVKCCEDRPVEKKPAKVEPEGIIAKFMRLVWQDATKQERAILMTWFREMEAADATQ